MNPSFWAGKRVLVTGHTGFKGSWLSLWLTTLGAKLAGFADAPPTSPNLFDEARIAELMQDIRGDVRSLDAISSAIAGHRPEIVFHLAAQPLVRRSYQDPVETYSTNVMGTVNLLEAVRKTQGVRAVVVVTSDKCYENNEWPWGYRENEPMGGHDPYSSSKGCAELVTAAYRKSFFDGETQVATARAGNVFGGGDWAADRLIPDIVRSISEGKPVEIRNPNSIRPWQHVLEPLRGYLTLAERLYEHGKEYAEGWNFGPNDTDARPVAALTQELCRLWGDNARWEVSPGPHPHEAHYLKLDCSKARSRLSFSPRLDLDAGLAWTVAWYRAWRNQANMRRHTENQIERYQGMENQ